MQTIAERIKSRRLELGISVDDVAEALGVNRTTVYRYESKDIEKMPITVVEPLAKVLRVTPEYIMGWDKDLTDYARYSLLPVTKHKIPGLGTVAAGTHIFADEDLETYIDPQEVDADFAVHVKGNSMIGDGINDNDVVYVRKQGVIGQGEIAVVLVEDEATLKHVYTTDGEIQLVASNPSYPPIIIRDSDHKNVSILGKAVGVYRTLNSQTKED